MGDAGWGWTSSGSSSLIPHPPSPLFRWIRLRWRQTIYHGAELGIRRWCQHLERLGDVSDAPVRSNHEQRAVIELVLGVECAVQLPDLAAGIAREHHRKIFIARPGCQRCIRIDADADDGYVAAVVEERGVLITVRLHLDRSAFGPRLKEEGQDYGAAAIV